MPASKLNNCRIDHAVIGDGSILADSAIKRCVFGIRSFVDEGCVLEDSIVMGSDIYETDAQLAANIAKGRPHLGLGKNCKIKGAIIDKNARIGDGCVLDATGKRDGNYVGGSVVIRDGVLVVPKGTVLPAGTIV